MNKQFFLMMVLFASSTSFGMVWIDLEMTGLDPEKDVILEIASIVTDNELNVIEEGPTYVIHQSEKALDAMNDWSKEHHQASGLTDRVRKEGIPIAQAEDQTLAFIMRHCAKGKALLCGNSIWQDRAFMVRYMPKIIDFLHYRIVDVSTMKEIITRWYPDSSHSQFKKQGTHRALDDIRESIAELRHYRKYFLIPNK